MLYANRQARAVMINTDILEDFNIVLGLASLLMKFWYKSTVRLLLPCSMNDVAPVMSAASRPRKTMPPTGLAINKSVTYENTRSGCISWGTNCRAARPIRNGRNEIRPAMMKPKELAFTAVSSSLAANMRCHVDCQTI